MTVTAPKPFVFVLMPFSDKFHDVYHLGIKTASELAGTYCERVDEQIFDGTILNRIYNQISNADIIIADMSGRNPNVFYEVGYAHALDKRVILLTQNLDDIPFDLKHYPAIVYSSVTSLRDELSKRLEWIVQNPEETNKYFKFPLRLFSQGRPLARSAKYMLKRLSKGGISQHIGFEVDVFNSPDQVLASVTFQFALVVPQLVEYVSITPFEHASRMYPVRDFKQDEEYALFLVQKDFLLLPGAWEKFFWTVGASKHGTLKPGDALDLTIRLLTNTGVRDHELRLELE